MKTLSFYPKTKTGSEKITIHDFNTPIKHLSIAEFTINDLISGGYEVKNEEEPKRYVLLEDNMLDEDEQVLFSGEIPYEVFDEEISNEDGHLEHVSDIWVKWKYINEAENKARTHKG